MIAESLMRGADVRDQTLRPTPARGFLSLSRYLRHLVWVSLASLLLLAVGFAADSVRRLHAADERAGARLAARVAALVDDELRSRLLALLTAIDARWFAAMLDHAALPERRQVALLDGQGKAISGGHIEPTAAGNGAARFTAVSTIGAWTLRLRSSPDTPINRLCYSGLRVPPQAGCGQR